jgi:3-hydroxyisobutyryl-CoA hydrolase
MSTSAAELFKEQPGDEPEDVVFSSLYGLRTIQLNRPKKLNSLNGSMVRKIAPRLMEWEKSDMANVIVMKGSGEKAFCAGGDVAILAQANQDGPDGWKSSRDYFGLEYKLDHYIATYRKPYVAFMDGITMGGGVGLSIHAPLRVATEKTVFAMPETTIGFFPDVGASFFLPRMNGSVGTYLALTSDRLQGVDVLYSGVATHYLHSTSLADLESRLAEMRFKDYDDLKTRLALISATIDEYSTGIPHDQPMLISGELRKAIDRCFSKNSIADIIVALKKEDGSMKAWAEKTLDTLHKRSPTAVNVTLRQMRISGTWSIAETFKREHQIAAQFMQHPDFTEGVTALLVRKQTPKWQPESLEAITDAASVTEPFFQYSTQREDTLELLSKRDYTKYPSNNFTVPTEKAVENAVAEAGSGITASQLSKEITKIHKNRQGVQQVVDEILARKTKTNEDGKIVWIDEE